MSTIKLAGSDIKIYPGAIVREGPEGHAEFVVLPDGDLEVTKLAASPYRYWNVIGKKINQDHWGRNFGRDMRTSYSSWELIKNGPAPEPKKAKVNKVKGKLQRRPMYLIASKNGMTHKGLATKVNERGVSTFGNSVTQALSRYEDKFGQKIDLDNAVVFKLVPHTVRYDKKRNKARIGSEIK